MIGAHIDGALSELLVVPASTCYQVGDLSADLAALVEPTSIGLQAITRAGIRSGDQVIVLGCGPIGQTATIAATDLGARVLAVDRLPNRLALAKNAGAEVVIDADHQDTAQAVRAWAGRDGPVAAIEATGQPDLIRLAVDLIAHSGTVVVVGITLKEVALPVTDFTRKEINLLGSRNNAGLFGQAVSLVQRHREQVERMVSHRFAFTDVHHAMTMASERPNEVGKVLISIREAT